MRNFPRQNACVRERNRLNDAVRREKVDRREIWVVESEITRAEERGDESVPESRARAREKGGVNEMIETRWSERTGDTLCY